MYNPYKLPDNPVENLQQPALAAAPTEVLGAQTIASTPPKSTLTRSAKCPNKW